MCANVSPPPGESPRSQRGASNLTLSTNGNDTAQKTSTSLDSTQKAGDVVGEVKRDVVSEDRVQEKASLWRRIWKILNWTPPNCRWDPDKPPQFSMSSTLFFSFPAIRFCFYLYFPCLATILQSYSLFRSAYPRTPG